MPPRNILFLCSYNAGRAMVAKGILNAFSSPDYRGFAAGDEPEPTPCPEALSVLARHLETVQGVRVKRWDVFARPGAPKIDIVINLCHTAYGEICAVTLPGNPLMAHWDITDPSTAREGAPRHAAFEQIYQELFARITDLIDIPPAKEGRKLEKTINAIGWLNANAA
jgi:arsenate reductase